jgi:hypothetical protein
MNMVRLPNGGPLPPHHQEAEETVIGAVLVHQHCYEQVSFLSGDDFYHPALRAIWHAIQDLHEHSKPIDVLTVAEQMRAMDTFERLRAFDGADFLNELTSRIVSFENIAYHARIVAEKATARRLVEACRQIMARGYGDYGDVEDLVAYATRVMEEARARATPTLDQELSIMNVASIPDDGPVKWLVRDLWLGEGVGIIGGEPKTFKSFTAAQLATCVASGRPMFGRHEVQRGRVLMYNAEDRPSMTRDRIARMCRALDVDIDDLDLHLIDVSSLRLDDAEQMAKLSRTVAHLKPSLLILDPLRDMHGLDENDAKLMSALLVPLRVLQREHHCAVIVVHHMAKLTETQRRPGQRLRGSSALHGWVDSGIYLSLKDGAVHVDVEHRAAPAPERFSFTVENSHMNGGDALWLEAHHGSDDDAQERQEKRSAIENAIIAALDAAGGPLTGRELRKVCNRRAEAVVEAIRRLLSTGILAEEPLSRAGQPVPGYRIADNNHGGGSGSRFKGGSLVGEA